MDQVVFDATTRRARKRINYVKYLKAQLTVATDDLFTMRQQLLDGGATEDGIIIGEIDAVTS